MLDKLKKISFKLYLIVFIAATVVLLLVGSSLYNASNMASIGNKLHSSSMKGLENALSLEVAFEKAIGVVTRVPAEFDLEKQNEYKIIFENNINLITNIINSHKVIASNEDIIILDKISENLIFANNQASEVFNYSSSFAQEQAINILSTTFAKTEQDIKQLVSNFAENQKINAEKEIENLNASMRIMTLFTFILASIGLLLVIVFGGSLAKNISSKTTKITLAMKELANNNLETHIPSVTDVDEIGDMARAVEIFKDNAIKNKMLEESQKKEQVAQTERLKNLEIIIKDFETMIMDIVETVFVSAKNLNSTASNMSAVSNQTSQQASTVSSASAQAASNVQTVASAAEELSFSIAEISSQVSDESKIAKQAVIEIEETTNVMKSLSESSQKINDVVNLITTIAGQTNLLALNATIEAARAGDAGKGFAVVANEVKGLADQTAKATEEITEQILDVQDKTKQAVLAITKIGKIINNVDEISTAIAAAIEEQGAATSEISRNAEQASQGTQEVSSNISGVTQASSEVGKGASQVLSSSKELSQKSELLKQEVSNFIDKIRKI